MFPSDPLLPPNFSPCRRIARLLLLLAIGLVAVGCIKVDAEIVVDDDGSGTVDLAMALDAQVIAEAVAAQFDQEAAEGDGAELCNEMTTDLTTDPIDDVPSDATIVEYRDDAGFCGATISYNLAAGTDHSAAIQGLFDGSNPELREDPDGDGWVFRTGFDDSELTGGDGDIPLGMEDMVQEMRDNASIRFVVDLPGRALDGEHNATSVQDGRFTWDFDLLETPDELFARTTTSSSGSNLVAIVGIIGAIAVAAVVAWWILGRSRGQTDVAARPRFDQ